MQGVPSACLEALPSSRIFQEVSRLAAPPRINRPSTNRVYDDLMTVLSHKGMAAAVQAKTMSDMIMSMELQTRVTVRVTPVLPQWDLDIILESLEQASLCAITGGLS